MSTCGPCKLRNFLNRKILLCPVWLVGWVSYYTPVNSYVTAGKQPICFRILGTNFKRSTRQPPGIPALGDC